MKFNVIRKWAKENNYKIKESTNGSIEIRVIIDEKNYFEVGYRESTIYRSVRGGMKGNPKGLYISFNGGYSFHKTSQKDVIESMEYELQE